MFSISAECKHERPYLAFSFINQLVVTENPLDETALIVQESKRFTNKEYDRFITSAQEFFDARLIFGNLIKNNSLWIPFGQLFYFKK